MNIFDRIKKTINRKYILYANSSEVLGKAQELLRPLPQGCELVELTSRDRNRYKCKRNLDIILEGKGAGKGQVLAVVDDNEIIAYHHGKFRGNNTLFFKVRNCDYECTEIYVDELYRRKGIATFLLCHAMKNLRQNMKVGTMISLDNAPSLRLHEQVGFRISHKVTFFNMTRIMNGHYVFINIPHYNI